MQADQSASVSRRRRFTLPLAMLVFLFAGVIYAWSSISRPFAQAFGWQGAALKLNFTFTLIFFCLGGLLSGLLAKRVSARARLILSGACLCAGFVLTARLRGDSMLPLYLGYGVLAGTGIGIAYNVVIAVTGQWYPDKKGLCTGCMMMAFGFSALVIGAAAEKLFALPALGWRGTYALLGAATGAVLLAAAFLLRAPTEKERAALPAPRQKHGANAAQDIPPRDMLRRASFYKLFLFFFLLASVGSTAIGLAGDVLTSVSPDGAALIVPVVGAISICNGIGRLLSGAAFDALGLRRTQYLTSAVAIIAPLLVLLSLITGALPLAAAGLCLCGVSYGFSPTVTVAFAGAFYGQKHFSLNLPILNLVLIPASFLSTVSALLNAATGSFAPAFALLTLFSLLGLIVNIFIRRA